MNAFKISTTDQQRCSSHVCQKDFCSCSNVIKVPLGEIVQMVLLTTISNPAGILNGNAHPVHLHGYKFQLLGIGYPKYDSESNLYTEASPDLLCQSPGCNHVTWSNQSWKNGNIPGVSVQNPALKDTVLVPTGGYVVIRFKADNPGFWYMHCHMEFHNAEGMGLVLQVGEKNQMNPPPVNMQTCGDFYWTPGQFTSTISTSLDAEGTPVKFIVCLTVILLAFVFMFLLIYLFCRYKIKHNGYTALANS